MNPVVKFLLDTLAGQSFQAWSLGFVKKKGKLACDGEGLKTH